MSRKEYLAALFGVFVIIGIWATILVVTQSGAQPAPRLLPTEAALPTNSPATVTSVIGQPPTDLPDQPTEQFTENRIIVYFAPESTQAERQAYIESMGGKLTRQIEPLNAAVLTLPDAAPLHASSVIATTEPDYLVTALLDVPTSDPHYAEQWGLNVIGAPDAWLALPEDAPKVRVAVIDSGVCAGHPDLAGRVLAGYDFVDNDTAPDDTFGHGCAVSGVIAANIDNGEGIAGVAPNAQIMPLRVLDGQGVGTYSDVAAAIVYAADQGADVINLSLGGPNASSLLADAVRYAVQRDVLVIAAAGNTGREGVLYPAAYSEVIAVGSIDPDLQCSSFSTYGPQIAVLAPGRGILTTNRAGSYTALNGTSMAAPHVSGAAAILIARGESLELNGGILSLGDSTAVQPTPVPVNIPPQYQALYEKAVREGTVPVIVGLDAAYQPEAQLSSAQAQAQRATINQVRSTVVSDLDAFGTQVKATSRQWQIPFVALKADPEALLYLIQSPDVVSIVEDLKLVRQLARSVPHIDADIAHQTGFDGTGQTVAILDDGIDADHEFFGGRVLAEACFSNAFQESGDRTTCPNNQQSQIGTGAAGLARCQLYDPCDHGTHVAGIAAGDDGPTNAPAGVAPGASIIAIQVYTANVDCSSAAGSQPCLFSWISDQIDGLQHVLTLSSTYNIASVNLSLGSVTTFDEATCVLIEANDPSVQGAYSAVIDALEAEDIATVIASGNEGDPDAMAFPACLPDAVSVGSVGVFGSQAATIADVVSSFSNGATTLDLLAPGGYINSSIPNTYDWNGGTSMAAPHVAGAWAILKQASPDATVAQVLNALSSTGVSVTDTRQGVNITRPRIDVDNAMSLLIPPLIVNTTSDTNDGTCNASHCSLREAIIASNASPTIINTIQFNISGGGQQTIVLGTSPLPTITSPVVINATTQPGFAGVPLIEIDGMNVTQIDPLLEIGLNVAAGNSTITGLVMNNFGSAAINLSFGSGSVITGNYLGTEPDGTTAAPNREGVRICSSSNNRIGGTTTAERNIISGNGDDGINICRLPGFALSADNIIQGNYIGTNAAGTAALGNSDDGIKIEGAINTLIGGTSGGTRNVISGNGSNGIRMVGPQTTGQAVQGNTIGPNAAGTGALATSNEYGVFIDGASSNYIGGSMAAAGNLISGNLENSIHITGTAQSNLIQGNRIGTDVNGMAPFVQSSRIGIYLDTGVSFTQIGGSTANAGNVIAGGNIDMAIWVRGDQNTIQGNYVGANTQAGEIGSGGGIIIHGYNNMIGGTGSTAGNVIAYNDDYGVIIGGTPAAEVSGNAILGNRIFANVDNASSGLGIDLRGDRVTLNDPGDVDTGPNLRQNFPVLTSANATLNMLTINGTLNSAANTTFRVEFFANDACDPRGYGEGQFFLGAQNVTTDGGGNTSFTAQVSGSFSAGQQITTTATDPANNTSEFSACFPLTLDPNILVVNTTNVTSDGVCNSHCSLPEAIAVSNTMNGQQTIAFNIPGSAPYIIRPTAALADLSSNTVLDATTQPGYSGSPIVVLDGSLTVSVDGLRAGSNVVIRGFVIQNFDENGVHLIGNNNVVAANYIGTDVTGTLARPNGENGVQAAGNNNLIGGTTAAARNLISGNANFGVYLGGHATNSFANTVQGNFIGTNAAGTAAIPNGSHGVYAPHSDNIIGGATGITPGGPCTGACNLISGNGDDGIFIRDTTANPGVEADNNIIRGNFIGTNAAGTAAIPNGERGIHLSTDTKFNLIGGPNAGEGNLISGNAQQGVEINGDVETSGNIVQGNRIGTNAAGTAIIPNGLNGVLIASAVTNNLIGGPNAGEGNLISGNGDSGIAINGLNTNNNRVEGNFIGTNAAGTGALGNTDYGVLLTNRTRSNTIGGGDPGEGNLISGNGGAGVLVENVDTDSNVIEGNRIGTNVSGVAALPNLGHGVQIRSGPDANVVADNLIAGNGGSGVFIGDLAGQQNEVVGNRIGVNTDGSAALPNMQNGIEILSSTQTEISENLIAGNLGSGIVASNATGIVIQSNSIGSATIGNGQHGIWIQSGSGTLIGGEDTPPDPTFANTIAFNGGDGVYVQGGSGHEIFNNLIYTNAGLGIDLGPNEVTPNDNGDGDSGANGLQNFPVITQVVATVDDIRIEGTLNSRANIAYQLDFYNNDACDASGNGEGQRYLGADLVSTNAANSAAFNVTFPQVVASGTFITVTAIDPSGNTSEFSACFEAVRFAATPGAFTVQVLSEINIQLTWTDESSDETHWLIERSLAGQNNWTQIASIPTGGPTQYNDTSFLCSRSYDYRMRASNQPGGYYSLYTPVQNAAPTCPTLNAPGGFGLTPAQSQIDLNWTDTNTTETGYRVEYSANNGQTWTPVATTPANAVSYSLTGLICNRSHSFRVSAVRDHDGATSALTPVQSTMTSACPPLTAPTSPAASPLSRSTIQFTWVDGAPGQTTAFHLERSTNGTDWTEFAVVPASTTSIIDSNLNCGVNYQYRARAFRSDDNALSPYSTVANATTSSCPTPVNHTVGLYKNGLWQFWQTTQTNQPAIAFNFGPAESGWTPVIGDWDGDGVDGIGVYKNGLWLLRNASGSGSVDTALLFGPTESGWQPVVGDWNGDGVDGIGVYKNGTWLLRQTPTQGQPTSVFNYGPAESGWKAIAGDWDGGGTATVGLFKDGLWLLSNRLPAVADVPPFAFGQTGWLPVAGDWDQDSRETAGIYKDGMWQLRNSHSGGAPDVVFGLPVGSGWQPVSIYEGGLGGLTVLSMPPDLQPTATPTMPVATTPVTSEPPTVTSEPDVTEEPTVEPTEEMIPTDTPESSPTTETPSATPEPETPDEPEVTETVEG